MAASSKEKTLPKMPPLCKCCHAHGMSAKPVHCNVCGQNCSNAHCPGRGGICAHCGIRPATKEYAADMMSYHHGFIEHWCEQCVLEVAISQAEESAARLPQLREDLTKVLAQPTVV